MVAVFEVKVYIKQIEQCSVGPGGFWTVNIFQNPPIEEEENETYETYFGINENTQLKKIIKRNQIKFNELFIFRTRIEKDVNSRFFNNSALKFSVSFSHHYAHTGVYNFGNSSINLVDFINRGTVEHCALLQPSTIEPTAKNCSKYFGGGVDNTFLKMNIETKMISGKLEIQRKVFLNFDKEFYLLYEKKEKKSKKYVYQNFSQPRKERRKIDNLSFFNTTRKDPFQILDSILQN